MPKIEVPVPGQTDPVTILPACRNQSISGNCAIVDFKVVQKYAETSSGIYTGKFYINWEDSEQGGDYDQDMAGLLSYSLNTNVNPNTITVTTSVFADSTPNQMGLATSSPVRHRTASIRILASTFHRLHRSDRCTYLRQCGSHLRDWPAGDLGCLHLGREFRQPAAGPAVLCRQVGWMEEADASKRPPSTAAPNDIPDQAYEWDTDGNGQPDNYFFARNPGS